MKKLFLVLAMLVSMQSFASSPELPGQDGGGGDGVMKDGELVLRDLIASNLTPVKDNVVFLKKIKGFDKLLASIAKGAPGFSEMVIYELSKTNIYLSPKKLPVLPYQLTTIVGVPAGIQLAARYGNDIIIAPAAMKLNTAKNSKKLGYLMIHEALHGMLENNFGPAHHQRVRAIVRYLYDNEGNVTGKGLLEVMPSFNPSRAARNEYHWRENTTIEDDLRCSLTAAYYKKDDPVIRFVGLENCELPEGISKYYATRSLLIRMFPGIDKLNSYLNEHYLGLKFLNPDNFLDLTQLSRRQKRDRAMVKNLCENNSKTLMNYTSIQNLILEGTVALRNYNESVQDSNISEDAKNKAAAYFQYKNPYAEGAPIEEQTKKSIGEIIQQADEMLKKRPEVVNAVVLKLQNNQKICDALQGSKQ